MREIKNIKTIIGAIILLTGLGISTGTLTGLFIYESDRYDELYIDYLELLNDFNELDDQYFILTGEHIELENDYNILVINLANMTTERDDLLTQIDALNAEISIHLTTISNLNSQIDVLEAEVIVLEEQATVDNETIVDLNDQIIVLNDEISVQLTTISGLEDDLTNMTTERDNLQSDLDALQLQYNTLLDNYQILFDANVELQNTYDTLSNAYNYVCNTIKQTILPVQYSIFAEAVRRYYLPIYLEGKEYNTAEHREASVEFSRNMVLHDSGQYNAFSEVSNAFSDALIFGNNTMMLAAVIMYYTFYPWVPNWDGYALSGDKLTDIDTVVQWCIDEIDYEYDSDITYTQEPFNYDYIKFPVETAFRTMGDCDDQMILTAAYLESCGFETAIILIRDSEYYPGGLYHYSLFVNVMDTSWYYSYPDCPLWMLGWENDPFYPYVSWCWLDTTWNVPFGSTPSWLQFYMDLGIFNLYATDIHSFAICDINGYVNSTMIMWA